jgi:hypothetical protein
MAEGFGSFQKGKLKLLILKEVSMRSKRNGTELGNVLSVYRVALESLCKRFALLVTLCLVLSFQAFAQNSSTGEITGTVTDTSGAAIPSAEVAVRNQATGVVVNVKTTGAGDYEATLLPPGHYQVTVTQKGFKAFQKSDIALELDQAVRVDAQLTVGSVSEVVNVVGAPPQIATDNSQIETNFSAEMTQELPLVGRAVTELGLLAPGVSTAESDFIGSSGYTNDPGRINVQGTRAFTMDATLNGGAIILPTSINFQPMVPSLGAVSEFAVIENNFGAQFGTGSTVLNMVTKSGTNKFHGTGFDYVENDALDATAGFSTSKPVLRYNQFGGAIGGPAIKNKLFFFFSYQNTLTPSSYPNIVTVPTASELQGNFSAFCTTPTSCNPTIVNPSTGVPFPDNTINVPFDTVAVAAAKYWPAPNYGPAGATANNYFRLIPQNPKSPIYDYKVDWYISKAHELTFTAHNMFATTQNEGDIPGPACYGSENCGPSGQYEEFFQLGEKWTISPNVVNSFFFSALREHYWNFSPTEGGKYPAKLGLDANGISQAVFPNFDISGGGISTSLGGGSNSYGLQYNFTGSDVLNWSHGKHLFALGGQFAKSQILQPDNPGYPTFGFNGQYTGTGETAQDGIGLGLADFLLGDVQSYGYSANFTETGARRTFAALFLQDDWKFTRTLTLNLGVRYQFEGGWSEAHNIVANFSPTVINPATNTPGAIVYASPTNRLVQENHPKLFGPRVGFAKSFGQKTVLRGGYGIFFAQLNGEENYPGTPPGYSINQSLVSPQAVPVIPPVFQLQNGPPAYVTPTAADRTGAVANGTGISWLPYNAPQQYAQEWHLSVQRQLDDKTTLEIIYVGGAGVHLETWIDADQVPPGELGTPADISNPQSVRPYPQYNGINDFPNETASNYNALEVQAKRRFANGLTFLANYTRSRSWDNSSFDLTAWIGSNYQNGYNMKANYGPSLFDEPNIVKLAYVYDLPFGKGRMLLNNENKVVDQVIGGWLTSGNFSAHSGYPVPVYGSTNNGSLAGNEFADQVGHAPDPHSEAEWFNLSNFANPAPYTFGNSRRDCMRDPGGWDYDFAMEKSFHIWESVKLKFRMDAYNFLNHLNPGPAADWLGPTGSNPALTGSGAITSSSAPRIIQIGAQIDF